MALITQADLENWTGSSIDASRVASVTQVILAAQSWIARQAGIRSLEKEANAVTVYLDSDNADNGTDLWLPPEVRPFWSGAGQDLMTVSADGQALTIASGYSATADVLIRGAHGLGLGMLYRSAWGPGRSNVAVGCKVGFATSGAVLLPDDVKILVMEVAWLFFTIPNMMGRTSVSKPGTSQSVDRQLSPQALATIQVLKGVV